MNEIRLYKCHDKNETLTLSGSLIQEKPFDLNKKLDSNRNFKVSNNY